MMYRKFRGLCKRVPLILLFIAMLCLLGACAADSEDAAKVEAESTAVPLESPIAGDVDSESQYSEAGNGQPQDPADVNGKQPGSISDENGESPSLSIRERYEEILLNNGKFLSADLNDRELSLADIRKAITDDDSITVNAVKFTIIDLDADGENEIVLWLRSNGVSDDGFEILRYKDENIYGYTLQYRAFMNLKTDGTFEFAGGTADTGIGKLQFSEEGYRTEDLVYSDSEYNVANELIVQYFAHEEACSEEEFRTAMSRQEAKPDVGWYALTENGVDAAFENGF